MKTIIRTNEHGMVIGKPGSMALMLSWLLIFSFSIAACSEESDVVDEMDNWQARNEAFFATLEDSLQQGNGSWLKLKAFSLDETVEGEPSDYVYAKVISTAGDGDNPNYTDSVRVSYQGRLINGTVFDGTVYGDSYSDETNSNRKFLVSSLTDGFSTALQYMHRGDYWRIYVPSALGYGTAGSGAAIPGHSVLIFDLTLIDFSPAGETMPAWSARRR